MRFGFHVSIAGGFSRVPERARERGCETVQLFTRSPRMWRAACVPPVEAEALQRGLHHLKISPVVVHTPYLLNLASPEPWLAERSTCVLRQELRRAGRLGADYVVTHLGSGGEDHKEALRRVTRGCDRAVAESKNSVILLLENSAGAGRLVGRRFEDLAKIITMSRCPARLGVCFDTAHAHAGGYAVTTPEGLDETITALDRCVGLERLKLIHGNDCKTEFASHHDRHWHIGEGTIGLLGFHSLIHHPRLVELPLIMETPAGLEEDRRNMRTMKMLRRRRVWRAGGEATPRRPARKR